MWWPSLSIAEQIFYAVAIGSSVILLFLFLLNLIGLGGHDLDMDHDLHVEGLDLHDVHLGDLPHDFDHDLGAEHPDLTAHGDGLAFISFRTILAFLVGFGWTGVVMTAAHAPLFVTLLLAIGVGAIFMLVVFWLMRMIYSLAESGNIDFTNALGVTGTVYIPIPPQGQGSGQVQLVVQGRLREIQAITDSEEALPTGTQVRVVRVLSDNTLLVRKVNLDSRRTYSFLP